MISSLISGGSALSANSAGAKPGSGAKPRDKPDPVRDLDALLFPEAQTEKSMDTTSKTGLIKN